MDATAAAAGADEGVRRLVITELVMENFKSYGGRQRVGPFHKSFSAVVGPNGSGKSNVIDAMLFVFGKKAQQLRLKKVSELIHNSTDLQNLEYALVEVSFVEIIDFGGDRAEEVPGSAFKVSREARRDNSSTYRVDGKTSSFTKVTELLKGKGIDLDNNRFLILQGEVEQISMMPPKAKDKTETGLLEYLEDIIGTAHMVEPLEEIAKTLDVASEERQMVIARVKCAEKDVTGLTDAKNEAEAYLTKMETHRRMQSYEAAIHRQTANTEAAQLEAEAESIQAKLDAEEEKKGAVTAAVAAAEEKMNAAQKVYDTLKTDEGAVSEAFKALEMRDAKFREDLKHAKERKKKMNERRKKAAHRLEDLQEKLTAAEAGGPGMERKALDMEVQLEKEQQKADIMWEEVREDVEKITIELQKAREDLAPYEAALAEAKAQRTVAEGELSRREKRKTEATKKLNAAHEAITKASATAQERRAGVQAMQKDVAEGDQMVAKADRMRLDAVAQRKLAEATLGEKRGKAEERKQTLSEQGGRGRVFQALDAARRKGKFPGLYGRLGDLGSIDARFDVAVSNATGSLDMVVVEDTQTAQNCVAFLRQNQLGVASFLILDKQRHLLKHAEKAVSPPEGVPRLYDLVQCADPQLKVAFYFALRDTMVAEDLAQASRIAYGKDARFKRVVTLAGETINESGAVTGGGQGPAKSGKMRIGSKAPKVDDARDEEALREAIAAAEQDVVAAQQALAAAADAETQATKEVAMWRQAVKDCQKRMPKLEREAVAEEEKAATLEAQLTDLQKRATLSDSEEEELSHWTKEVTKLTAACDEADAACGDLRAVVAQLQAKMDAAGGAPLRRQRDLVTRMGEEIQELRREAVRVRASVTSLAKQVAKAEGEVAGMDREEEELVATMELAKTEMKAVEDEAAGVVEQLQTLTRQRESYEAELALHREEYEEKNREGAELLDLVAALVREQQDVTARASSGRKTARHWEKELTKAMKERHEVAAEGAILGFATPTDPTDEELASLDKGSFESTLAMVEFTLHLVQAEMDALQPDMGAIAAFREKTTEYESRIAELAETTAKREGLRADYEAKRRERLEKFMHGFNIVALRLKEMYQMITMGGDAELELVDSLDPFSEGIVFSVRPPRKSWKNIANLSGGEKTLSSLALVFALHHFRPTPLYVMDEIDAALDFRNVSIVGHYIKERTKDAQFIIISLRNNMFELADRLVGIYKTNNQTKSVTINPEAFAVAAQGGKVHHGAPLHEAEELTHNGGRAAVPV